MNYAGRVFFPIVLFFFLSACQGTHTKKIDKWLPAGGTLLSNNEINSIATVLKKRSETLKTLTSLTKVSISDSGKKKSVKQVFLFKKNSFLRLEYLSMFGQPFMFFFTDYKSVKVYYPGQNILVYGMATKKNIKQLIGINLTLSDLIEIVTGNIKIFDNISTITAVKENNLIYVKIIDDDTEIYVSLDRETKAIQTFDKFFMGIKTVEVIFDEYRQVGEHLFPYIIVIKLPHQEKSVTIRFKNVAINKKIKKGMDELYVPKKSKRINLDQLPNG